MLVSTHALPDSGLIDLLVEQAGGRPSRVLTRPQGTRRAWLEQAGKNAEMALARALTESGARAARTLALAEALELDTDEAALDALRIECFDISHTAGEATQASCVVLSTTRCRIRFIAATTLQASRRVTIMRPCARC